MDNEMEATVKVKVRGTQKQLDNLGYRLMETHNTGSDIGQYGETLWQLGSAILDVWPTKYKLDFNRAITQEDARNARNMLQCGKFSKCREVRKGCEDNCIVGQFDVALERILDQ